jgi:phenylalanyl-tRNA synthetase alpha chain
MSTSMLSAEDVRRALSIRDLTDPAQGQHALQLLVGACVEALARAWGCASRVHRASPIVSVADNYDRLRYPPGGPARDARYTRYVCDVAVLRTQTSAMIPALLRGHATTEDDDVLPLAPGSCTGATASTGCTQANRTSWTSGESGVGGSARRTCGT